MRLTLREISQHIGGKIIGNTSTIITGIGTVDENKYGDIIFIDKQSYMDKAINSEITALICSHDIKEKTSKPHIVVKDPRLAFIKLLEELYPKPIYTSNIEKTTSIGIDVVIGANVTIMQNVIIMDHSEIEDGVVISSNVIIGTNVKIGENTFIHPNVNIGSNSIIGNNNIIFNGAVIGSDGFGFYDTDGIRYKVPQVGHVKTGDNVEIGANTCIDRGTVGKTSIGNNTKIDNLVQIAHNCRIGDNCYIAAQVGIGGSSIIGNNVRMAGQVGIADHTIVGDNVICGAQAGVYGKVKSNQIVLGTPYRPYEVARRIFAAWNKLPELIKKVKVLEKFKAEIENK